ENDVGNYNNLPPEGELLIITKSYKDHRVLRNVGYNNVIWFQNEGCIPDRWILNNLVRRFKRIIVLFDSDYSGTMAAIKLCNILNVIRGEASVMRQLPLLINGG